MDDLALISDLEGRLTYANPAAGRLLGCRQEHLVGRFLWDIIQDSSCIGEMMQSTLDMGQWRGEVVCHVRDSSPIPVRLRAVLIQAKGGDILGIVVMGWDLRPERQMEHQLIRYERQRLLGEMASGMAHNFNNILVGIQGHAQMLQADPDLSETSRRSAGAVVASSERAAELVDRLQRSARGDADAPESAVNLDEVIRSCVTATEPRWRHQPESEGRPVEVETDLGTTRSIDARRSSIDEVLTNFIFNAVDAMPDGGRIAIRSWDESDSVCFSVSDTGTGMDRETLHRLGELFFTTKGERGHGLGLPFCYRIVDQLRGTIDVESEEGKGTTFVVRLPAGRMPEQTDRIRVSASLDTTARVLVVEDDKQIRGLVAASLDDMVVDVAEDGTRGMVLFRSRTYDLVILDLSMPGPNGIEIASEMRSLVAGIRLILMTGWDVEDPAGLDLFDRVIRKPFSLDDFRSEVETLLAD